MRFQAYTECCWANMWAPMHQFLQESGSDLVIMGQRHEEHLRNRLRDAELTQIDGVSYWHPLHAWTTDQVLAFIRDAGEALPPFYEHGAESSADCWNCTAYLDHNISRLRHLHNVDPGRYSVVSTVLLELQRRLRIEASPLDELLSGVRL